MGARSRRPRLALPAGRNQTMKARGFGAAIAAFLAASSAAAQPALPDSANPWAAMTRLDLEAMRAAFEERYIYAVYPDPAAWRARFDPIVARARRNADSVTSFAGYRAVLQSVVAAVSDTHVGLNFRLRSDSASWPGFLARYIGGRYRVAASDTAEIPDGAEIENCDGERLDSWADRIASFESGLPAGLAVTRASSARLVFVDQGSPYMRRPSACTIGGRNVTLSWRPISLAEQLERLEPLARVSDRSVSIRTIGDGVAWVRLGFFSPRDDADRERFLAALREAPALRDRRAIVIDVRGNGGGPYDLFVGFLYALYGREFADHFARARTHIRPVMRLSDDMMRSLTSTPPATDASSPLRDPATQISSNAEERARVVAEIRAAAAAGRPTITLAMPGLPPRAANLPANPVRARVFLLTDYGCASACIGFVDEMRSIPGVVQIGVPTSLDRRSGTALPVPLPSGNAVLRLASMQRDGRQRGDNVSVDPDILFDGDILDNAAVERWVLETVLPGRS